MRTLIIFAAAVALCGCGEQPKETTADFGAAKAARIAVDAESACDAAGFADLASCADASGQDARRRAKVALSMAATYTRLCAAELGRDRCDDMLMSAYFVAKK